MACQQLGVKPSEFVDRLRDGDPDAAFAMSAAAEEHSRKMELWEAHFDHLQAIAKAFRK